MEKATKLKTVPENAILACDLSESDRPPDYQSAFCITASSQDERTAEEWARRMYEAPPKAERLFVGWGWKALTARLGPYPSDDHILGYRIRRNKPNVVLFSVSWRIGLKCDLILSLEDGCATLVSLVWTPTKMAKVVWSLTVPIHELIVPRWLRRASRTQQVSIR